MATTDYDELLAFADRHRGEDPLRMVMQGERYPGVNLGLVAQQLEGRKQAEEKWPSWAARSDIYYPPRLNREQASSEATARYKAKLSKLWGVDTLADLTGGMGVDTAYMAAECGKADYYEIDPELCDTARHNFAALGLDNIDCHCGDGAGLTAQCGVYDLMYIDPARRDANGRKVAAFEQCSPPLPDILPQLMQHCRKLMVKASPMIDLALAQRQLGAVEEIHIVALRNECKEVLFVVGHGEQQAEARIICVNLQDAKGTAAYEAVTFTTAEENAAEPRFAGEVSEYLYEPNAALMKGGCYNSICQWYGVEKLARNTHLYTSSRLVVDFPGRRWRVVEPMKLNAKTARQALPGGKAHVVARNYPMTAQQLQQKLRLAEGGDKYVVAATVSTRPTGWLCEECVDKISGTAQR